MEKMFDMLFGMYHTSTRLYSPFRFVLCSQRCSSPAFLFFGLDLTDILGSFDGCDGGAVVEVSRINWSFFYHITAYHSPIILLARADYHTF